MTTRPTRRIQIEGAYNVRDLGGYETTDGRYTTWKMFLRGDDVSTLPRSSQDALTDFGVRTVIDLRGVREIDSQADNAFSKSPHMRYRNVDIVGDVAIDTSDSNITRLKVHTSYRNMLDLRGDKFRDTLATMAEPDALPVLFHCVGGQDRTGLVSAILLGLVGVPNETIAEDYTLTAEYRIDAYLGSNRQPDTDPAQYTSEAYRARNCPPDVMLDTLDYLDDRYGGVEGYVKSVGVTDEQIATLLDALLT